MILDEYEERKRSLSERVRELVSASSSRTRWFSNHTLLHIRMDDRCLAASWAPLALFSRYTGIKIVAPWPGGYVVDVPLEARSKLLALLGNPTSQLQLKNISSIEDMLPLHETVANDRLRHIWEIASSRGRKATFVATLAPFSERRPRQEVLGTLQKLWAPHRPKLVEARLQRSSPSSALLQMHDLFTEGGLAPYIDGRVDKIILTASHFEDLIRASGAGTVSRWDPVTPLSPTAPGIGPDPGELPSLRDDLPIVGVIDGGVTSNRYQRAVAWRAPPFIDPVHLDATHGNSVAGLIVDGHAWNNQLDLPDLYCRIGVAPAVPVEGYNGPWSLADLLAYIDRTVAEHPNTKVWNISANVDYACDSDNVSPFGHALSIIARQRKVLFVISSGNREDGSNEINIAPPGDAGAAITVSGRNHKRDGTVGGPCSVSRVGRGPDDMLKPELSWFSVQRVGPNTYGQASSWAAPLVSRLAAHTWNRLREPTPSLVKALLLTCADHHRYNRSTGFGSPVMPALPWETSSDRVLLTWKEHLEEKRKYIWDGIKIPRPLIRRGKLIGRIRLVVILEPEVQTKGGNYYSTRIEASVRYKTTSGEWNKLVGSVKTETAESLAREVDNRWQPVRCDTRNCSDLAIGSDELRVQARLFWRDKYCHQHINFDEYKAEATFALLFSSLDGDLGVHDDFITLMGSQAEATVTVPVQATGS